MSIARLQRPAAGTLGLTALLLLGAVPALPAGAQDAVGEPWELAFNPDAAAVARAAAAIPAVEGEPAVLLLSEASYRYDDAGRETSVRREVYRLVGNAHESWSTVVARWSPWYEDRPEIRARVVTPDGQSHPLDPAVVTENGVNSTAPELFEDARLLRAPLPATGPDAVVETEVTLRQTRPLFEPGIVRTVSPTYGVHCRRSRVILDLPAARPLSWVARLLPPQPPREERTDGRHRLTFEYADLPGVREPERGLPLDVPRYPYLAFSTASSWGDIARRYGEIVDQALRGADVSALLGRARRASSREEAISHLLTALAPIRYTGVELGEGGIVPRPPGETLRRRFGDCKDKAVLLVAALRALEIPAWVALLDAGLDESDVEESLPGFGGFDHAIVFVPGETPLWIDPTDPYARAGELPTADQGRLALVASPTSAGLIRTPEAAAADNLEVETREFRLADLGRAQVTEVTDYHGDSERRLRAWYAVADRKELRESLAEYAADAYLAEELADFSFSPPDQTGQPFRLKLEMKQAGRGYTDLQQAVVALLPGALLRRMPAELRAEPEKDEKEREHDYRFVRPSAIELRFRIVPPAGFAPRDLPAAGERTLGTATFSQQYTAAAGGEVTAVWRFDSGKRRLSPAEFAALRQALQDLAAEEPTLVYFEQTGEALLAAGRLREALDEIRRLAAAAPKSALPRTRLARALLAGGLGSAARDEAKAAVRLEPTSATAHATLGWVLQHDEIGRRFGSGWSRPEALAAYRKAKELDPQDVAARGDLAILLEHDADGRRYTPQADLAAAIVEYQSLRQDLEENGFDDNLLLALLRADRLAEMKQLLDEVEPSELRSRLRLVALAAMEGPEAALREAERRWSEPGARLEALTSTAQTLIQVRRYQEAAVLFGRAGQKSPQAAALLSTAELLRRVTRHEETTFDPALPETPVRQLTVAAFSDFSLEKIRPLVTDRLFAVLLLAKDAAAKLEGGRAHALRQVADTGVSPDVMIDLGIAGLRSAVSGSDPVGYRVVLTAVVGEANRLAGFVVRTGDSYRIAGLSTLLGGLGLEALHRLEQGDLAGARQWLDWAREESAELTDEDALPASPFAALWPRGQAAHAADIGEPEVRCAAVALASELGGDAQLAPLAACRAAAEAAGQPARRDALDLALASLYRELKHHQEELEIARRLNTAHPDSERGFQGLAAALAALERWEELHRAADERLAGSPDNVAARRALSEVARIAGDLARSERELLPLLDSGKAGAGILNDLAWGALVQGRADEQVVDWAQRAATMSSYRDASVLHTLASIYAERGKAAEGYQILLQSLAARSEPTPDEDDWYVLGRLAEDYGLADIARALYRRALPADPPKKPDPTATRVLVAARLAALGPAPPPEGGRGRRP